MRSKPGGTTFNLTNSFRNERLSLFAKGTAEEVRASDDYSVTFEELIEKESLDNSEYAYFLIKPYQLTSLLKSLVYILDVDHIGNKSEITLPFVEITVLGMTYPIRSFATGKVISETWAAVEFSYEDTRLNEEVHCIRDLKHPLFKELKAIFGCGVGWGVVCY